METIEVKERRVANQLPAPGSKGRAESLLKGGSSGRREKGEGSALGRLEKVRASSESRSYSGRGCEGSSERSVIAHP
jgi:hypothetical protein